MLTRDTKHGRRPRLVRDAGGKPKLVGYCAVFYDGTEGTEYELSRFGSYRVVERVTPSAFNSALARPDDVRLLIGHDPNLVLGRTASGTLRLSVDATGLKFTADPPDTTYARDLMECMRRGDVSGASFSFDILAQTTREIRTPDGTETIVVELDDVKLYDGSICAFGAYSAASSAVRQRPGETQTDRARAMAIRAEHVGRQVEALTGRGRRGRRTYSLPSARTPRGKAALAVVAQVEADLAALGI